MLWCSSTKQLLIDSEIKRGAHSSLYFVFKSIGDYYADPTKLSKDYLIIELILNAKELPGEIKDLNDRLEDLMMRPYKYIEEYNSVLIKKERWVDAMV